MRSQLNSLDQIRKKLGRVCQEWKPQFFLDLGPDLNKVFGDPDKGLAYGKIVELSGNPSNGKTALCIDLAAAAQQDGAVVVWNDIENSFDQPETPTQANWYSRRGLECHRGNKKVKGTDKFILVQPYIGHFKDEKEARLITGQELLTEVEQLVSRNFKNGIKKQMLIVDSAAAILTEDEAAGGVDGQNMKTSMSLPKFLSGLMKRWVALMQNYNCIVIFTNQLRHKPMAFGDPSYSPGGNAIPFYAHVRVRMGLTEGGKILKNGHMVGIKGVLSNRKNKAGGIQHEKTGYKIYYAGNSKFFEVK